MATVVKKKKGHPFFEGFVTGFLFFYEFNAAP